MQSSHGCRIANSPELRHPVNRIIPITQADMQQAYSTLGKRAQQILSELDYGDYLIEIPASQ